MLERKIAEMIQPVVEDLGYALVGVEMKDGALQIMAENPATRNLGVDECATISRAISATLDVENPIKDAYRLEVSSPGIDRPLVKEEDFSTFAGHEAKIELDQPLETGQKRFRGFLKSIENGVITLKTDDQGDVLLPFTSVRKAKLILTDELINDTKQVINDRN